MQIRFTFHPDKAVQAMAYLVARLGPTEKVKLMKLMYLADRQHFIEHGLPVTGDRQCAMPWGPVPSATLSTLDGQVIPSDRVFSVLHLDDNLVSLRGGSDFGLLSAEERKTLDAIAAVHGRKQCWRLVRETHDLPEYKECYVEGTSRPIPYELIAQHGGNESRYRQDRAVISPETAREMACPFGSGADL